MARITVAGFFIVISAATSVGQTPDPNSGRAPKQARGANINTPAKESVSPPSSAALSPALSDATASDRSEPEARNLQLILEFHNAGTSIQKLRDSGLLADDVEWWVAGPKDILPFAGTWHGLEGIAEFQQHLRETMKYDKTEILEYIVDGDNVAAIFKGSGHAVKTARPFESLILRLYTLRGGRIVRVRNFFDTAAYVAAVQ